MGLKAADCALIVMLIAATFTLAVMLGRFCQNAFQPIIKVLGG